MPQSGDIKTSVNTIDHSKWYLLDGRAVSALPADAFAAATLLGFNSLPDATDTVIGSGTGVIGTVVGDNEITLSNSNLPDIVVPAHTSSLSGGTGTVSGTSNTIGSGNVLVQGSGTYGTGYMLGPGAFGALSVQDGWAISSFGLRTSSTASKTVNVSGTVSIGANTVTGLSTPINITPRKLLVNTFIWLE